MRAPEAPLLQATKPAVLGEAVLPLLEALMTSHTIRSSDVSFSGIGGDDIGQRESRRKRTVL
jgi:hypothetical protein